MEGKICPLLALSGSSYHIAPVGMIGKCLGDRCAWHYEDVHGGKCAIKLLFFSLEDRLSEIRDRLGG